MIVHETKGGFEAVRMSDFILRKDGEVQSSVRAIIANGWQEDYGIHEATGQDIPAGKVPVGKARIVSRGGLPAIEYDLEDVPVPPSPVEQLEMATGLTVDQIKEILGIADPEPPVDEPSDPVAKETRA